MPVFSEAVSLGNILTIGVTLLVGVAIPVILLLVRKLGQYKSASETKSEVLQEKRELTEKELSAVRLKVLEDKLESLRTTLARREEDLRDLRNRVEKLSRDQLKQLADFQTMFVSAENYTRDLRLVRTYMKTIYERIRQQADLLDGFGLEGD